MSDRIGVMSAGRLLQVGTPREIYEAPANRFVAGFIGETQLLARDRVGAAWSRLRGRRGGGRGAAATGARCTVAIRPERLRLVPRGRGDRGHGRRARPTSAPTPTSRLRLGDGTAVDAAPALGRGRVPAPGARVGLRPRAGRRARAGGLMARARARAGWLLSAPRAPRAGGRARRGRSSWSLAYSFLSKGAYGGAALPFTLEAWRPLVVERDIFDGTLAPADAPTSSIFWRSVWLSLATTGLTFALGLPTAWFIATRPERSRPLWLFLITIPFWTNLLIRTFAILELIRNEGLSTRSCWRSG